MHWKEVNKELGNIDIYWLDFILKGYLRDGAKILDVGCGEGRNLIYCMKNGHDIFGIDKNEQAIYFIKLLARQFDVSDIEARFKLMDATKLIFPNKSFDVVLSSAVFHFAENALDFDTMWSEAARILKPGGSLVVRAMTTHFLSEAEQKVPNAELFTDKSGHSYYLLNDKFIDSISQKYGLEWIEPFKYVQVGNKRSMATCFLRKNT